MEKEDFVSNGFLLGDALKLRCAAHAEAPRPAAPPRRPRAPRCDPSPGSAWSRTRDAPAS